MNSVKILEPRRERVTDTSSMSDKLVARRIQAGQRELFTILVREHSDRLYFIILRMVQSPSPAQDILQDTWVKIVRKFHKYDPSRPLAPWLTRIAVNCCRDYGRRERLRSYWKWSPKQQDDQDPFAQIADDTPPIIDDQVDISKALLILSPKLRVVVVLKFFSGLTHSEIADILKVPTGTVKSRLNNALSQLRRYFDSQRRKK